MRRRAAAVVGAGQTEYSRGSGRDEWSLAVEAVDLALADAGVSPSDVDGLVRFSYDTVDEAMLTRSFQFDLTYYSQTGYGGLGAPALLGHAYAAVASGLARVIVCYRALNGYSGTRYGRAERSVGEADGHDRVARGDRAPSGAFAGPYGLISPAQVMALWARRYQWEVGITEDDLVGALGQIAVDQRHYARRNPRAVMRKPLDETAYLDGRTIATPLRIFDLALETDGAAAVVVASPDVARAARQAPVWITGSTIGLFRHAESISVYGELRNGPSYRAVADRLFAEAGCHPTDLSAALIYDATSISVLLGMEAYGLAPVRGAWRQVREQGIGPGAPVPVNTCGGHLSEAYVHGVNLLIEAVRQCRGSSSSQVARGGPVLLSSGPSAVVLEP